MYIRFFSGAFLSGFHLRSETVLLSNIESESQACHVTSTDDVISMDVFRNLKKQGITTVVPSVCDGTHYISYIWIKYVNL